MNREVLCGMSGGVDSSVTAYLLREQGYQVAGCTMRLFDNEDIGQGQESSCCSLNDVEDAKQVCYKLGLPHYVFHFAKEFRRDVMCPFARAYLEGRTPNPCIDCNRHLKFGRLVIRAAEVEMRYVATGHYARITRQGDRWLLQKSVDRKKDQTYFLYHLTQQQMDHFLMPLGELTKEEVRGIAAEQGFPTLASETVRIFALSQTETTVLLSSVSLAFRFRPVRISTEMERFWAHTEGTSATP